MIPQISIIVPCYNQAHFLDECLQSVMNQTFQNWECVVVNDGSTDNTLAMATKWTQADSRFKILDQANSGLAAARNNGIALSVSEIILPLDADNKLKPIFLERAINLFQLKPEVDVVHGNAQNFGEKSNVWFSEPFDFSKMVLNNYIDACAAFRKTAWEKVNGFDLKMPVMGFEDWDFWLRLSVLGSHFEYVNELLFDYRVREQSMLTDAWQKRDLLLQYIFSKKELSVLKTLRILAIENQKLKETPSFKAIFKMVCVKFRKKIAT